MLEVMWKVVEGVIDTLVKAAVQFHDVLHGFHAGRGTGTAIMAALSCTTRSEERRV